MGLADIATAARADREAKREALISSWEATIAKALEATVAVGQADVRRAAEDQKLPENLAWVSLNEHMPEGALEAWVDVEGVLDIEVPRDIAETLAARVEAAGIRCGVEVGPWSDRAVLHVCVFREPPPAPEPPDPEPPAPEPVPVVDGGE